MRRAPFRVRPGRPEELEAIVSVTTLGWQTAYRGLIDEAYLAALAGGSLWSQRLAMWRERLDAERVLVRVAEQDGGLVGVCAAGPNRTPPDTFAGEVYSLYLLESARRQGIGRALFHEALGWLSVQGQAPVIVWALSDNAPACRFYAAMGGLPAAERLVTISQRPYRELGFAFRPLSPRGWYPTCF